MLRNIDAIKGQEYVTINPRDGREADAGLQSAPKAGNIILHFHDVMENVIEYARQKKYAAFFNISEPRDVFVSLIRLHDVNFREAVRMTNTVFHPCKLQQKFQTLWLTTLSTWALTL